MWVSPRPILPVVLRQEAETTGVRACGEDFRRPTFSKRVRDQTYNSLGSLHPDLETCEELHFCWLGPHAMIFLIETLRK